jgi:serine/threonine protein kinase
LRCWSARGSADVGFGFTDSMVVSCRPMRLAPGMFIGHYRLLEQLGEGGMGVVYRARDERLERDVAMKLIGERLLADATARGRFLREARTASALNPPNICTVHEVGDDGDLTYIVMELVTGR